MLTRLYLIGAGAAVLALLAAGGVIRWQSGRIDALKTDKTALTLLVQGCQARTTNMSEDKESDNAINDIPDADLGNVPDGWILPETGAGSVH